MRACGTEFPRRSSSELYNLERTNRRNLAYRDRSLMGREVEVVMGLIDEVAKTQRPVLGSDIPLLVFRVFRHFSADMSRR